MERVSPEPKIGTCYPLADLTGNDLRKRKALSSLTPLPSNARPASPSQQVKPLEKTFSKNSAKREKHDVRQTKETMSGRKSKHADIVSDVSLPSQKMSHQRKKLPLLSGSDSVEVPSENILLNRLKGPLRGIPKRQEPEDQKFGNSSPPMRQWEFKMPRQGPDSKLDTSVQSEGEDEAKSLKPPQGPPPILKFQRHSLSVPGPQQQTSTGKSLPPSNVSKGKQSKTVSRTKANPQGPNVCDIVVSGHQRLGILDDDSNASSAAWTLALLEGAVARERRLKEELSQAHKQVLFGFRSVVRNYFSAVGHPHSGCSQSSLPPVFAKIHNSSHRPASLSVPLLKCSVVVHTLVTNIQSYLRQHQSRRFVEFVRRGGNGSTPDVRLSVQPLSHELLSEWASPISPPTTADAFEGTDHSDLLDSTAIAQLKQLYFAYYDCESYVLDPNGHSPTAKRLGSAVGRDIRNVIEEANVLVAGYDDMDAEAKPSVSYDNTTAHEGACGSMLFDEEREWKQIYSDDDADEEVEVESLGGA